MFSFRPFQPSDFKLLHRWRNQPHVDAWWDGAKNMDGIRVHYEPYLAPDYPVRMYIASLSGIPFGRIQYEATAGWLGSFGPEVVNIDFLIGREKDTGQGYGPKMISQFVEEVVFTQPEFSQVIADPDAENERCIKALEKAGFSKLAIRELEGKRFQFMIRMKAD